MHLLFWGIVAVLAVAGYALILAIAVLVLLGLLVIVARAIEAVTRSIYRGVRRG